MAQNVSHMSTHKRAHTHSGLDDASSFTSLHTRHIRLVLKCLHLGGLEAQVSDRLFASHMQGHGFNP